MQSRMRGMTNLGGFGGMLPENFEKLTPLRLKLRVFLMVYCLYRNPRQHIHCNCIIYLVKLIKELHYLTDGPYITTIRSCSLERINTYRYDHESLYNT